MSFLKEFDHLKIQMKDIRLATDNFNPIKQIGHGGFGSVYKGELSYLSGRTMAAFKRLDRRHGQGNIEFWKEIMMLSKYKHENLVSLMHFCIEDDEMILVYEFAAHGSLDRYLKDPSLTWIQRLKICVEVARALHYLHDPVSGTQHRLVHRDIKSSNILLDENWIAKVSDFGLSNIVPANQPQTFIFSYPVGTPGYCDPLYFETGFLSKESDVYSFGVVMLEVICGRLCFEYNNGELTSILVPKWRKCYEEKRLDEIIFLDLKEQMERRSLTSFMDVAYRCVKRTREERPKMAEVLKELEYAHQQQEIHENHKKRVDDEQVFGVIPPSYDQENNQLFILLLKGILVDNGKTLNIDMRVTIRDSLFRLAQSSLRWQYDDDAANNNGKSGDEASVIVGEGLSSTKSSSRTADGETEPDISLIRDRVVAHLLFHTPPAELLHSPLSAKQTTNATSTNR